MSYGIRRREFLAGLGGGLAAPITLTSCALTGARSGAEAPVIDTHMHVWSADPGRFPFAHPYEPEFRPPSVAGTVEVLLDEMDRFAITHAVLVQVIYHGWDNAYVAACAREHPRRFRAQGLIDPVDPGRAGKLDFWMREHGLSGMRFSPIYYPDRDQWLDDPSSDALWKRAGELGAIFNFFIATPQLPRLENMVRKFPDVRVVIDHLARVDLKAADPLPEFQKLLALARYPNVWAKVTELCPCPTNPSGLRHVGLGWSIASREPPAYCRVRFLRCLCYLLLKKGFRPCTRTSNVRIT